MTELVARRLDVDALRALQAIRHHGGVTRAAVAMGLSQSAVSHKIKRLETNIGCELLNRRPDAPMFTALGQELLDYADRILSLHDEALLSLSKTSLAGRIALGMTEDTSCTDLSRILGRFRRLHPQVSVKVQVRMSLTLRAMLDEGTIDAALLQVFSHEVRPTDVVLFREELHWVKSPECPLAEDGPVPFLSFDDACFYRHWAFEIAKDSELRFDTVFECSSAAGIISAVTSGLGVAILSSRHLRQGMEVVTSRLPQPPPVAYVVRRARKARNSALDVLVAEIQGEAERNGGLKIAV
jgi:DNA-binding transcriptional LysR family regulator